MVKVTYVKAASKMFLWVCFGRMILTTAVLDPCLYFNFHINLKQLSWMTETDMSQTAPQETSSAL